MSKKTTFEVVHGNYHLTVSPRKRSNGDDEWRFGWKNGDKWKYVTRKSRDAIRAEAKKVLAEMAAGFVYSGLGVTEKRFLSHVYQLTPREEDRAAVLRFLRLRQTDE